MLVQVSGSALQMMPFQIGARVPMNRLSTDTDSAADVASTTSNTLPSASAAPAGSKTAANALGASPLRMDTKASQFWGQHKADQAGNEQADGASRAFGKVPLDQDTTASQLASLHSAGVVAAASALTTMLTLSAETSSSWQIPVHVQKLPEVSNTPCTSPQDGGMFNLTGASPDLAYLASLHLFGIL